MVQSNRFEFTDKSYVRLPSEYINHSTSVTDYVNDVLTFITDYRHFYEFHAVDFFVEDYWRNHIPQHWHDLVENEDLDSWLDRMLLIGGKVDSAIPATWPDDLVRFIKTSWSIGLVRQSENALQKAELDNNVRLGMSLKKIHEVEIMAKYVSDLASNRSIDNVVDVGAGQGYLSSVLAFKYGLTVLGVDYDTIQTCGANRRSEIITKRYGKQGNQNQNGELAYLNKKITAKDKFSDMMNEWRSSVENTSNSSEPSIGDVSHDWIIIGLHTCGDLAPSMLKMFKESEAAIFVNVGCCYNLLTEHDDAEECSNYGFPMSQHLADRHVALGEVARTVACQATVRWTSRAKAKESFIRHFYRSLVQLVLVREGLIPANDRTALHSSKIRRQTFSLGTFPSYVKQVLVKLPHVSEGMLSESLLLAYYECHLNDLKKIAFVWTLRALVAEAIESLILLDRWLWLREQGIDSQLFPLFDHKESPRNMVIVGIRPSAS